MLAVGTISTSLVSLIMFSSRVLTVVFAILIAGLGAGIVASHSQLSAQQAAVNERLDGDTLTDQTIDASPMTHDDEIAALQLAIITLQDRLGELENRMAANGQSSSASAPSIPDNLGEAIDAHIMARPGIIQEALAAIEMQRTQQAIASVLNNPMTPVIGNPDGDVTLIEFFDYNCGYCRQMSADLRAMADNDPNLKIVLVELPILSAQSQDAARVSLAAYQVDPDKYEKFHFDLILGGARADRVLAENIATLNLYDLNQVKRVSRDPMIDQTLQMNYRVMDALGISGTPAIFLDGILYRGRTAKADLESAIDAVRTRRRDG